MIPVDEITLAQYARTLSANPPLQGYLTISNALQWRLQYKKIITRALDGVVNLDPPNVGEIASELMNSEMIVDPLLEEE